MKTAIIALMAVATLGSAANATTVAQRWNPKAPENSQLLTTFNYATVESVVAAIGAKSSRTGSASNPALSVVFANNRKAVLTFGGCNGDGSACNALSMQANWTKIANSTPQATAGAIQSFNQRYSFGKAFMMADGRPGMQRYLTADYGFVRGNLAVNMLVFANQVDRFATEVLQPLETGR